MKGEIAKETHPEKKHNGGNRVIIGAVEVPLEKLDKAPDFRRPGSPAIRLKDDEEMKLEWYKTTFGNVQIFLTNGSELRVENFNNRHNRLSNHVITLVLHDSSITVKYFGTDDDRSYRDVRIKGDSFYQYGESRITKTDIYCDRVTIDGKSDISKSFIRVEDSIVVNNGTIRGVEVTDFTQLSIYDATLGNWNSTTTISVNPDGDAGDYRLDIRGKGINIHDFSEFYPSVPCKISISHRVHYGQFTGIKPVQFVKIEHNNILLNGHILVTKDLIEKYLASEHDVESMKDEMYRRLWFAYSGCYKPLKRIPAELVPGFKQFLVSVESRMALFDLVSVINK